MHLLTAAMCLALLGSHAGGPDVAKQVQSPARPAGSVSLGSGFPAVLGVYGSYWLHDWVTLDAAGELALGLAASGGGSLHIPLVRHGNGHRHALVGSARLGYLVMGGTLSPKHGPYQVLGAGYGYRGPHIDVRFLVGIHSAYYTTPHPYRPGWESKPMVSLQVGKNFG